jgi:predicted metal-dependent enzyme (double-stranded beta helix superfamily)
MAAYTLDRFVADLDRITREESPPERITERVAPLVIWRPGDTAAAHNHETWGVIGVVENEETRYRVSELGARARLDVTRTMRHKPGAVSCLVPGDEVHAMHNATGRDTVEIHVYGQDLVGLRRKTWTADGTEKPLVSPKYLNC